MNKMLAALILVLSLPSLIAAQQINRDQIIADLERDGCVTLSERKLKGAPADVKVH